MGGFFISLIAVAILIIIGMVGAQAPFVFGVAIPYVAIAIFIVGIIARLVKWARSPVPFRITTTTGQQRSLSFIRQNKLEAPYTPFGTFVRMALEILFFRSLFRNTSAEVRDDGQKLAYGDAKYLWLFSLAFHWSFLIIFLRHFRFFVEPIPSFVPLLQNIDGFFQIGVPIIYLTNAGILAGLTFLVLRRIFDSKARHITLLSDWFPLFLIMSIAVTGVLMRYFIKTDLVAIKELAVGIFSLNPVAPAGIDPLFYIHLFLVCALLAYFPVSKLMHMGGVFMTPTRNMPNNSRAVRHVNPWNPEVAFHSYEEYEDEFRDVMIDAGVRVDKGGPNDKS